MLLVSRQIAQSVRNKRYPRESCWMCFTSIFSYRVRHGPNAPSQTHSHVMESNYNDTNLFFFSQQVINRRNSLTQEDIDTVSVNSFKNKLEKKRTCQMDFFKDK